MQKFMLILLIVSVLDADAQSLFVGKRAANFTDPLRDNRPVPTLIYYPAESSGDNAPMVPGNFPLIVFGHGFQISYSTYENISDYFVPRGYIVAFANTENNLFTISHSSFAADLRFIAQRFLNELNIVQGNIWYEKFNGKAAVMGHSMGGGASMLAASGNNIFNLVVGLAPAETTPSAINAMGAISAPLLIFAASKDNITPASDHQIPMYEAASQSQCKSYVNILGAAHCQFGNTNSICELVDNTPNISRAQHHSVIFDFSLPYMETFLKGQSALWPGYLDSLANSPRIESNHSCGLNILSSTSVEPTRVNIFPNPAQNQLMIESTLMGSVNIVIYDVSGKMVLNQIVQFENGSNTLDVRELPDGVYIYNLISSDQNRVQGKFILAH